jgi:type IV fimbrial biogenesis protein FimT
VRTAPPSRRRRGFSLIEMMVVVAMLAVIMSIAAPGMREFLAGQQVKSTAFDLTADLLTARSEALKRNRVVTVAPVGGDWRAGWSASVDGQEILRRGAVDARLRFDDAPDGISFNVFGRVADPADAVRVTVRSTAAADRASRCVELDLSGRAGSGTGACT